MRDGTAVHLLPASPRQGGGTRMARRDAGPELHNPHTVGARARCAAGLRSTSCRPLSARGEEREWPGAAPDRNCTIRTPSEHEPDARRDRDPPPAGLSPPGGRNANGPARRRTGIAQSAHRRSTSPMRGGTAIHLLPASLRQGGNANGPARRRTGIAQSAHRRSTSPMRGGTAIHPLPASPRQGGRNANGPARHRTGIAQSTHRRAV